MHGSCKTLRQNLFVEYELQVTTTFTQNTLNPVSILTATDKQQ